jgi:hypothetical protein
VDDREIEERIASFPRWHYGFELRGHQTPSSPARVEAHRNRAAYFMEPVIRHFGGSLEGKRVLDLGCNAGFWSLHAAEANCDFVLGIDGRQMHIDQANFVFEVKGFDARRYEFVCANVFDFDYEVVGPFDIVLCLGLLYHVNKPISLLEAIAPVNTDLLVIDTKISTARGSSLDLRRDQVDRPMDAVDYDLVMVPTARAVIDMAQLFGYDARALGFPGGQAAGKYAYGDRMAFICSKASDLDQSTFEFQEIAA